MSDDSPQNQPFSPSDRKVDGRGGRESDGSSELPDDFYSVEADEYEPPRRSRGFKVARVAIGFLFILATIYLFGGVHEYLFFRETPEAVEAPAFESRLAEARTLVLPVEITILIGDERGSSRSARGVRDLVAGADEIWDQAAIDFEITDIRTVEVSDALIADFLRDPRAVLDEFAPGDDSAGARTQEGPKKIRVVLTRHLSGLNGIAYSGLDVLAVADFTTYFDFEVLAHEIGHILGLSHVNETGVRERLMYQGSRGMIITETFARRAREAARMNGFVLDDPASNDTIIDS